MLFLPSHCVTCVRKTRWRIIILCLLYNFNTKCRCIIISAFSSNSPINRRTNQNLPCWRFALWRYSSTRLSSVLLSWDIFTCRKQANQPTVFFGAHTSTDNQPATRWLRINKGELQLSILHSTSISLKLYSSAYVVSQRILTSTLHSFNGRKWLFHVKSIISHLWRLNWLCLLAILCRRCSSPTEILS